MDMSNKVPNLSPTDMKAIKEIMRQKNGNQTKPISFIMYYVR
jgi:hypothetical protein